MTRQLISNTILSLSVLLLLFSLSKIANYNFSLYYYFTVVAFFLMYLIQTVVLFMPGLSPSQFLVRYNFTTILKMLISLTILIVYYLLFAKHIDVIEKIYFSVFFISTYFVYLIIHTKNLFKK